MANTATGTSESRRGRGKAGAAAREVNYRVVTSDRVLNVIDELQRGLPYRRLTQFEKRSGLSLETIGRVIRVPRRTLARRKAAGRLGPVESERLYRLSELFAKAVHLFAGDAEQARDWLQAPQRAFGGTSPLEMAESEVGARQVEDLMIQLEHGVFP